MEINFAFVFILVKEFRWNYYEDIYLWIFWQIKCLFLCGCLKFV
jgi:hypothetical protein